jgi:hypothetical protein
VAPTIDDIECWDWEDDLGVTGQVGNVTV